MEKVAFSASETSGTKMSNDQASSSDPRRNPINQPWYYYKESSWEAVSSEKNAVPLQTDNKSMSGSQLRLLTWNIDVMQSGTKIRMSAAITYLKGVVDATPTDQPLVIFLQEMCVSDLKQLQNTEWIQKLFYITDLTSSDWDDPYYGTTTLVDRRLSISKVFRVHFRSQFGRDGLFVDINTGRDNKVLRFCNTHLESLVSMPPLRPPQLALAAKYLHAVDAHAGILAGDLNAIQPFDKTLHIDNDLQDAFLTIGGEEGQEEGFTWGYQSNEHSMKKYGPCRMDKVFFCGNVSVETLDRIGIGEKVEDSRREELQRLTGGLDWITDHYGLAVVFNILT